MEEYLKLIGVKHRLRDPIYGFVFLTEAEKRIIDTPLFQRLRRVHQLALTKYVYPSAEHSRFVHSIGVMHCATLILSGILNNQNTRLSRDPNEKSFKTLRFAALLHDIGHLPFSHAIEKKFLQGLNHEDLSQYIIEHYQPIVEILSENDIKPKEVASLLAKKPRARDRLFHEIISGQLDADRADYLLRDAHFCGARYGEYDFSRFLQIFAATDENEEGSLTLFIDENDLYVAESVLIARYHYNLQIPFHRTRTGYDLVLERFFSDFPEYCEPFTIGKDHLSGVDFSRFVDLDDYELMEKIKKEKRLGNIWAPYLLRDKHLVPIVDTSSNSPNGVKIFKEFVLALGAHPDFQEGRDYFIKRQEVEIIKGNRESTEQSSEHNGQFEQEIDMIRLQSREGKGRNPECIDIRERSWIFRQFAESPPTLHRVYLVPEMEKKGRKILDELGHGKEAPP